MKSQRSARLRSTGFGLHRLVSRTSFAWSLAPAASTRRVLASQLAICLRPSAVSRRRTTVTRWLGAEAFAPRSRTARVFVSRVKSGTSKVLEEPLTLTIGRPAPLFETRTSSPRARISFWLALSILTRTAGPRDAPAPALAADTISITIAPTMANAARFQVPLIALSSSHTAGR